jgi:hypothetical protein
MVDLESLKKRIELVDVRLKTAHSARERESDALKQLWEQIHGRFDEQKGEIAELRKNVAELKNVRDDLLGMVQNLLGSVEDGLESMTEETVPYIRQMAGELLSGGEEKAVAESAFGNGPDRPNAEPSLDEDREQDELLAAIEHSLNNADDFMELSGSGQPELTTAQQDSVSSTPILNDDSVNNADDFIELSGFVQTELTTAQQDSVPSIPDLNDDSVDDTTEDIATAESSIKPLSPGIRNLVVRLEGFTLQALSPEQTEDEPAEEADLNRDLREIEVLRGELMGLRERVSAGH